MYVTVSRQTGEPGLCWCKKGSGCGICASKGRACGQFLQVGGHVLAQAADMELALALIAQNDCQVAEAVALEVLLLAQHAAAHHVLLYSLLPAPQPSRQCRLLAQSKSYELEPPVLLQVAQSLAV